MPKVMSKRAVEAMRLVVDLGGVAGDRDQVAALLAEIDGALDEAQLLVLGALGIALARAAGADGRPRSARCGSGVPQRARRAHLGLGASSRVTCQYQPDSGRSNSGSPRIGGNLPAFSSGVATSATSVRR